MNFKPFNLKRSLGSLLLCGLLPATSFAQQCNPAALITTPTSRFIDNGDGVVTDTKTNLMWQKCSYGQSGNDCSTGATIPLPWKESLQYVESLNNSSGFAGHVDWRLPNAKELSSLLERSCFIPAINLAVFPNVDSSNGSFWSSTPYINPNSPSIYALSVGYYGLGGMSNERKEYGRSVRLVRNATPTPNIGAY